MNAWLLPALRHKHRSFISPVTCSIVRSRRADRVTCRGCSCWLTYFCGICEALGVCGRGKETKISQSVPLCGFRWRRGGDSYAKSFGWERRHWKTTDDENVYYSTVNVNPVANEARASDEESKLFGGWRPVQTKQ